MDKSSEKYDSKINEIDHYKKFPAMRPYIGINYDNNLTKLMLIAESHFLPRESNICNVPEVWYNSTEKDLSTIETEWINTRKILEDEKKWKNYDSHYIYIELNKGLLKVMNVSDDNAFSHIVFMNGFQRPSPKTGDSIKNFCKPIDYKIGTSTIKEVIEIVKPNLVLFVSKLGWDTLRWNLPKFEESIEFDFVCHPGTGGRYWHNKSYKHGKNKFIEILSKNLNP